MKKPWMKHRHLTKSTARNAGYTAPEYKTPKKSTKGAPHQQKFREPK